MLSEEEHKNDTWLYYVHNCGSVSCRVIVFFFFFSSRRRHTRYWRDWSSDVCSSDLTPRPRATSTTARRFAHGWPRYGWPGVVQRVPSRRCSYHPPPVPTPTRVGRPDRKSVV